jgi:hypothetical protein
MADLIKCPMCKSPVLGNNEDYSCPKYYPDFEVPGSVIAINRVGHVNVSDLRKALHYMMGSYQSTLNF